MSKQKSDARQARTARTLRDWQPAPPDPRIGTPWRAQPERCDGQVVGVMWTRITSVDGIMCDRDYETNRRRAHLAQRQECQVFSPWWGVAAMAALAVVVLVLVI